MPDDNWQWDETLFAGTAPYYTRGRLPYAAGACRRHPRCARARRIGPADRCGVRAGDDRAAAGASVRGGRRRRSGCGDAARGGTRGGAGWHHERRAGRRCARRNCRDSDLGHVLARCDVLAIVPLDGPRSRVAEIMLRMLEPRGRGAFVQVTCRTACRRLDRHAVSAPPLEAIGELVRTLSRAGPARRPGDPQQQPGWRDDRAGARGLPARRRSCACRADDVLERIGGRHGRARVLALRCGAAPVRRAAAGVRSGAARAAARRRRRPGVFTRAHDRHGAAHLAHAAG